jgi:hypothetical protein
MQKQEADNLPRVEIKTLLKEGLLSGKQSGLIHWHDPSLGNEYIFRIGSVYIDEIEDLYPDDDAKSQHDARPLEGLVEFTSMVIATLDENAQEYKFSQEFLLNKSIALKTTPCNYGKSRFWFSCPGIGPKRCRARVGVLYWLDNRLACRKCHDLTYKVRNIPKKERHKGRLHNIGEIDRMWSSLRKYSYKGKPTKKYLRAQKMTGEHNAAVDAFLAKGGLQREFTD